MIRLTFSLVVAFIFLAQFLNAQIVVKNSSELTSALKSAKPGDKIILSEGFYADEKILIEKSGTAEKKIEIIAEKAGKSFLKNRVNISGNHVILSGIFFKENGQLEIMGENCTVLNCLWDDVKTGKWLRILPGSKNIEIANCTFRNKNSNLNFERDCQLMQIVVMNENEKHFIHHNLFDNIPKGSGNGFETLQLITKNNPFDPPPGDCNTLIENNLFYRCDGEAEIISVKSNGNIIRKNTFYECFGGLVFRHGDDNLATQNYFLGENKPGSGGIRIQGSGQIVANNYFQDLESYGLGMMDGTPDDLYIRVENAQILFNSFINCRNTFVIGINHSKHPNGAAPKDCSITGNLFFSKENGNYESFFDFVQNDQPENWIWHGNLAFGRVAANINGIEKTYPFLLPGPIYLPRNKTPLIAINEIPEVCNEDLFGKQWELNRTVGAIQYPFEENKNQPLTKEMVGCNF